jgi:hypothetical protein
MHAFRLDHNAAGDDDEQAASPWLPNFHNSRLISSPTHVHTTLQRSMMAAIRCVRSGASVSGVADGRCSSELHNPKQLVAVRLSHENLAIIGRPSDRHDAGRTDRILCRATERNSSNNFDTCWKSLSCCVICFGCDGQQVVPTDLASSGTPGEKLKSSEHCRHSTLPGQARPWQSKECVY